jgi:uncharacterized protein
MLAGDSRHLLGFEPTILVIRVYGLECFGQTYFDYVDNNDGARNGRDIQGDTTKHDALSPFFFLTNPHFMTIAGAVWPRQKEIATLLAPSRGRLFAVAPHSKILAYCSIDLHPKDRPTLLIVHGLEGSSSSPDILSLAAKAISAGMNVVRMNLRNCGNTLHLSPTLYNAGNSSDVLAVVEELRERDGLTNIFLAGYSLGGNIVTKLGGELAERGPELIKGICAISPAIELSICVGAMEQGFNWIYEKRFLHSLKDKIRQKHKLFPQVFTLEHLKKIKSVRQFDDLYTAPDGGFSGSAEYYARCSAMRVIDKIDVPTLIITAKDDPLVPFQTFASAKLQNPLIMLLAPDYGGHAGFINSKKERLDSGVLVDRFWAENRVIQFCQMISQNNRAGRIV